MKVINIDGKELEFAANAATPIRYKQVFHEDMLSAAQDTDNPDYYGFIVKLAYVLNAQAEGKGFAKKNFDNFCEWLEGFSSMAFLDVADDIVTEWTASEQTTSASKK